MKDEFAIKKNYYKRRNKEYKKTILAWRNDNKDIVHGYYVKYREKYDKSSSIKQDKKNLQDKAFVIELIKKLKEFIEEIK